MVALTNLDQQADCPLTISPASAGKCKWISTQTVEFTPKQRNPATKYSVIVKWDTETYTWTFTTPLLQRGIGQKESLREGIQIIFNFPIKEWQLQQALVVTETESKQKVPVKISLDTVSGAYIVQPKSGSWKYMTTYSFTLNSVLDAQNGNLPTSLSGLTYTTLDAMTDVQVQKVVTNAGTQWFENYRYSEWNPNNSYQSIFDLYDTSASSSRLLPLQDIAFDISFEEKITDLSSTYIRLIKDGITIPGKLSYLPEISYDPKTGAEKKETTKKKVRLLVTGKLSTNSTYELVYTPDGKTTVASRVYETASALNVSQIEMLSYSKVCLYVNNPLDDIGFMDGSSQTLIKTTPKARVQSIGQEEYMSEELQQEFDSQTQTKDTIAKFLAKNDFCPQPKDNQIVYVINTRLNPSTTYTLTFNVKDIYGHALSPITKTFTTDKIKDKDKFLYIGYPEKNTIPRDIPLVVNIQSINTTWANIAICGMDVEQYLQNKSNNSYDNNGNKISSTTTCTQSFTKDMSIKNNNRLLSNTRVDIEKDLAGETITTPIIHILGSLKTKDPVAKKRWFSTIFVRTNLSLMLEQGTNKNVLLATTFNGTPVHGLSFKWYRFENGSYTPVVLSARYDSKKWTYELSDTADVMIASNDNYRGMIESESDITQNYDFGYIAGQGSMEKEFLYLYTERPIYKPGDTVYFKWILRNFNFDGFHTSKITGGTIMLSNELGEEIMKIDVKIGKNSNFDGSFIIPKDMSLGWYSMKLHTNTNEDIYTNASFVVEEYHKPVFKINAVNSANDIIAGDTVNITLDPVYYFWGKVTNTIGNYQILTQKYFFNAKEYSDFQFWEDNDYINCIYWNECNYMDTPIFAEDSTFHINVNGNYLLKYPTSKDAAEKVYSFIFQVQDPTTQKPVSTTVSEVVHATDGYVGIQIPYRNSKEQWIVLHAVTLDRNAEPKVNTPVTIKLIKQDRKAIKKQGIDGVFYYDYSLEQTIESTQTLKSDGKGLIEKTLQTKSDGEYLVLASYQGKWGVPFVSSQTVYVSGKDPLLRRTENNSVTKVIAEKTMVNIGDIAQYTIQSPINTGTIFIAVEKDDGILKYFTMPLQGYANKFQLKIEKEYYPNIYLRVFLIWQQKDNPLPIYKRWLAISKVNTLPQKLSVNISTNKELYLPGDKPQITVKVTDAKNAPVVGADLSISIVDQSLLALKGNPIKNPFAYFYDMKRFLWTFTWLSLNTLVEKLEIKDTSDGSKGWDGGSLKWGNSRKKRWIFKDTAYRNAHIVTDTQGQAKITADALPDNLTTRVIESLVNTPDTKIGIATDTIQTALPLMINPNVPNFLSINDTIVFHPVIFNKTDKEQIVSFTMSGTYLAITTPNKKITIPAQGKAELDISALITGNLLYTQQGASKIEMEATTSDADVRDAVQLYVPVIQNTTKETVTTVGIISEGKATEQLEIPKDLQWALSIVYSKSLFGSLLDGISGSTQSDYACLEQRFSSFMAHVYIKKLFLAAKQGNAYDLEKIYFQEWVDQFDGYQQIALPNYIRSQLASLTKNQNTDGGFVFRNDTTLPQQSSVWLTTYIISSLAALRDVGFTVADKITANAMVYLKNQFYDKQKFCVQKKIHCEERVQEGMDIISAIIDFAPSDHTAKKMLELIDPYLQDNLSITSITKKAMLLGKLGNTKDATTILTTLLNNQLVMEPKTAHIGKYSTYDNMLHTAYFLEASSYLPTMIQENSTIYQALERWIAEQKKNGQRWSSQDTISVVRSLTRFIQANPIANTTMKLSTQIWSTKFTDVTLPKNDPFVMKRLATDIAKIDHSATVTMWSDSKETAYYDLTLTYFVPAKDSTSRDEWFVIQKKYYNYEAYMDIARQKANERAQYQQNKISYQALKYPKAITEYLTQEKDLSIGEVLVVDIHFVTSEPREQVAIDHYIPAGTELINPNLATESTYTNVVQSDQSQDQFANFGGYGYQSPEQTSPPARANIQTFSCDKEEFRTERHFCYVEQLNPGNYNLISLIRVTNAGNFAVRPTMIFEFYHPENFGRTFGQQFTVTK